MPNLIPGFSFPVTASATFGPYVRVKLSSGVLALAGASDDDIGILDNRVTTNDTYGSVQNPQSPFPHMAIADGVIAQYAAIYAGANGKVSAAGSKFLGYALEAGVVDGDEIQIWRAPPSGAVSSASSTTATSFAIGSGISTAKITIDTNSATGNFTSKWVTPNIAGNVTITFPAVTSTLATLAGTETLTNKTLTTPVIGTGLTASGSASNDFSGSTGAYKTSTGLNTVGGKQALKVIATPVAATGAGGGVAGAAALGSANIVVVSSDGATKGVKLLTGVAGDVIQVLNSSSTACNLFAASGGTINGGVADVGCAIPASKGVIAVCTAADTWTVFDFTAHSGAAA